MIMYNMTPPETKIIWFKSFIELDLIFGFIKIDVSKAIFSAGSCIEGCIIKQRSDTFCLLWRVIQSFCRAALNSSGHAATLALERGKIKVVTKPGPLTKPTLSCGRSASSVEKDSRDWVWMRARAKRRKREHACVCVCACKTNTRQKWESRPLHRAVGTENKVTCK